VKPRAHSLAKTAAHATRYGVARVLSKRGVCSRSQAEALVRSGRVQVNGHVVRDPEFPTLPDAHITVDEQIAAPVTKRYFMLNKARGVVSTNADEHSRQTVRAQFAGLDVPHLAPVGRLDQASEGLLLLSNDSIWAAAITAPESKLAKIYHVQINACPQAQQLSELRAGVVHDGDQLRAEDVQLVRSGGKTAWLAFTLTEGKNRQIRRMCSCFGFDVLRLIRVQIGGLALGDLAKGQWRELTAHDLALLRDSRVA
jgi:23S rRNA pseudouridine2605 synthase